jgi:hypothetical protein
VRTISLTTARLVALVAIVSLSIGALVGVVPPAGAADRQSATVEASLVVGQTIRPAADLSQFRPGNLISDTNFSDSSTMTAAEIQTFLQSKVPVCRAGYVCLKDWTDSSRSVPADAMCRAYSGVTGERASQIIFKVAQACSVNPRVLLVMLQKEQGLVTHTWPSDWRYTIAMGQGCPDTAACDTRYYGFFNQVYGAAWQLKRYANPPGTNAYFTWYAPGKTWSVRYHPNAACGSSPVFIENQATANLYYYTPYQPNAAALSAGYGEGDGCSAYGNRNFFNYFTDWFGSPTAEAATLVKTSSAATVWIATQGSRWALSDYGEYADLSQVFGAARTVSEQYLNSLADRGAGSAVIRDSQSGSMALVQSGMRWGLSSCAAVAIWGGSCANPINVPGSFYRRIAEGPLVSSFARLPSSPLWALFDPAGTLVLQGDPSALRMNAGVLPDAPKLSVRAAASLQLPAAVYAPGELLRTADDATVMMTDGFGGLVPLSSFAVAKDLGLRTDAVRWVDKSTIAAYARSGAPLTPLVTCGGVSLLPASGVVYPLTKPADTGWVATELSPHSCALLGAPASAIDVVLLKNRADATVYVAEAGVRRALGSWTELIALAGPNPRILTVEAETLASLPLKATAPPTGTLVKGSAPSVYIVDGQQRLGLPSFALARELGLSTSYTQLSDAALAALADTGTTASVWVRCSNSPTVYFAASGTLHAVRDVTAFSVTGIGDALCSRLNKTGSAVDRVFVKGGSSTVYVASGGVFSPIGSWSRLLAEAGGTAPTILRIDDAMLRTLPMGPLLP